MGHLLHQLSYRGTQGIILESHTWSRLIKCRSTGFGPESRWQERLPWFNAEPYKQTSRQAGRKVDRKQVSISKNPNTENSSSRDKVKQVCGAFSQQPFWHQAAGVNTGVTNDTNRDCVPFCINRVTVPLLCMLAHQKSLRYTNWNWTFIDCHQSNLSLPSVSCQDGCREKGRWWEKEGESCLVFNHVHIPVNN